MLPRMYRQDRFKRPLKTVARKAERSRQIAVLAAIAGVLVAGLFVAGKLESLANAVRTISPSA